MLLAKVIFSLTCMLSAEIISPENLRASSMPRRDFPLPVEPKIVKIGTRDISTSQHQSLNGTTHALPNPHGPAAPWIRPCDSMAVDFECVSFQPEIVNYLNHNVNTVGYIYLWTVELGSFWDTFKCVLDLHCR